MFQDLLAQLHDLVSGLAPWQQVLALVPAGAIPFIESYLGSFLGTTLGIHPALAIPAAVLGNLVATFVVIALAGRTRDAIAQGRGARGGRLRRGAAERGDPRAAEHGREAAQIARTSLAEIRSLVRGYREADLATELQGTASLLRSAHAEVTIEGSADDVPSRHRGTAAWVLREGGTNILRHADPSAVTITLSPQGIRLVNDGAPGDGTVPEGSGLTGMRERLEGEAVLEVRRRDGVFALDVRFAPPGGPR